MRKVDTPLIVRLCLPQFAVGLFTTMRTEAVFPYAAAVPFILPVGTDARQFTELSDAVIRFAPSTSTSSNTHRCTERIRISA